MVVGCLPQRTMVMGSQWTPLQIPVPTDVPPCHCNWLEQIQLCYPPGPERTVA